MKRSKQLEARSRNQEAGRSKIAWGPVRRTQVHSIAAKKKTKKKPKRRHQAAAVKRHPTNSLDIITAPRILSLPALAGARLIVPRLERREVKYSSRPSINALADSSKVGGRVGEIAAS